MPSAAVIPRAVVGAAQSGLPPAAVWGDPANLAADPAFLATVRGCLAQLPDDLAHVLVLREGRRLGVADICRELGITASECDARLYRARMRLRSSIEAQWLPARSRG